MVNWLVVVLTLSCAVTGLACASGQDLICLLLRRWPPADYRRRRHQRLRAFWRVYAAGMAALALVQTLVILRVF